MLERLFLRVGLLATILLVTVAAILASLAVSTAVMWLGFGGPNGVSTLVSVVVPLVCAPGFTYVQMHLVQRLQRAQTELHRLSVTDELTGAFNRRHFFSLAGFEQGRAPRYQAPYAMALLDIDDFKRVNDLYGHLAGDAVLQRVVDTCHQMIRASDVFARFGGEEFVLFLPQTDAQAAAELAERLRRHVAQQPVRWGMHELHLTVSVGVAAFSAPAASLHQLVMAADRALYIAKAAGKNQCITVHSASEVEEYASAHNPNQPA